MKKLSVMLMAVGLLLAGASSAVELNDDCSYVYNGTTGLDPEFLGVAGLLNQLDSDFPLNPALYDIESVAGVMDGDGIPDAFQLGMLGAVMCDPSGAAIVAQFNNNISEFLGLTADLGAVVDAGTPVAQDMATVGADVTAWATAIPDGLDPGLDVLKAQALQLGGGLVAASEDLNEFVGTYGPVIVFLLPSYKEWFAGIGGPSTEMSLTLDGLLGDLLSDLTDAIADFQAASAGLVQLAAAGTGLVPPPFTMTPALATAMTDLAADIDDLVVLLLAVALPDFEIYGAAKLASEPFSAAGDYNGDGLTNGETYTAVTDAGGDRDVFVSAATGTNPFWPGNPGLPVTGMLGLAALAVAAASAGAMVIRRK